MRAVPVVALLLGCGGDSPPRDALVVDGFRDDPGIHAVVGAIGFSDGATVSNIAVQPDPLVPAEPLTVRFTVDGAAGPLTVGVRPPADGGRQVALGGPDAPPPTLPPDRRAVFVETEGAGDVSVELTLTAPWHPRTAMVTLERSSRAVAGPRTHDGRGVLALVDVEQRPTEASASRRTIEVDGALDEWGDAPASVLTSSLDGEPVRDLPDSEVRFAWDDERLYVGAKIPDRDIRGTLQNHDDPLWDEEVFEVFVFGDAARNKYIELQVSPLGVTFDKRFTSHRKGDQAWTSAWTTAVAVDGTIERAKDRDEGWTAEAGIPWAEICENTEVTCPPAPGTSLRLNVFRFERPRKGNAIALSLSPTRVPDFHAPENAAVVHLLP